MGLFDVSEEKKCAKMIRKEGKALRKDLIKAGLDKKQVDAFLEEYLETLELAWIEQKRYKTARTYMKTCIDFITEMVPDMCGMPVEVCKEKLMGMLKDLPLVYHDCLVRKDDMDFESTFQYLNRTIPSYTMQNRLMMQSELENLRAVFADILDRNAPEFVALAYFLRHGRSELLSDMENSQRNNYMENFFKDKFWDVQSEMIEKVYMLERVLQFENQILAKTQW